MTYTKTVDGGANVELSMIELHIINQALFLYNQKAWSLTENPHHCDAVEVLHTEINNAWCADEPAKQLTNQ